MADLHHATGVMYLNADLDRLSCHAHVVVTEDRSRRPLIRSTPGVRAQSEPQPDSAWARWPLTRHVYGKESAVAEREVLGVRLTHWLLGIVLGAITGGSALVAGVLALIVVVPVLVWAAREPGRPFGLAGLLVGVGLGVGGLFAMADARCAAFDSTAIQSCSSPDATPYVVFAVALMAVGASLTIVGLRRARRSH